jgi:uncharacterized protein YcaQ
MPPDRLTFVVIIECPLFLMHALSSVAYPITKLMLIMQRYARSSWSQSELRRQALWLLTIGNIKSVQKDSGHRLKTFDSRLFNARICPDEDRVRRRGIESFIRVSFSTQVVLCKAKQRS